MNKITLYVGLNDKDTKTQVINTLDAVKVVTNIITAYTDGCTIYNAQGIYTHDNGDIVIENTLRIELFECVDNAVNSIIDALKKALNQESIIKQTDIVNSEFC